MSKKIPVIIDCDPGLDDAMALLLAFTKECLDIKLVSTVGGNLPLERTIENAIDLVSFVGGTCEVAAGAVGPFCCKLMTATDIHGASGVAGFNFESYQKVEKSKRHAVEAMRDIITNSKEKVTIIALGPLTNVALLFAMYPEVKANIEQISLMGGGFYTGNHSPCAEFNILVDPEAAYAVYESGVPIIMAGLDITHISTVYYSEIDELRTINKPAAELALRILDFGRAKFERDHVVLHDTVAVLAVTNPEIFKGKHLHVAVEYKGELTRGYTMPDFRHFGDDRKEPNVYALLEVDRPAFAKEILDSVKHYCK